MPSEFPWPLQASPSQHFERFSLSHSYATNVFHLRAMAEKLSAPDLEAMTKVIHFKEKIQNSLVHKVAAAVKEWALEKGATHYGHWFLPHTGLIAQKQDSFLHIDLQGGALEQLTANQLLRCEADASSFPSGGLRFSWQARGYAVWDPSSFLFLRETKWGKTLCIPSLFMSSVTSQNSQQVVALDSKLPLLRSQEALSQEALKTLRLLPGSLEKTTHCVVSEVGAEQEFFLIDFHAAQQRPDLLLTGRTVFGNPFIQSQEYAAHYFSPIPPRVENFFNDIEQELHSLGVPIKTRHTEVGCQQYEIVPLHQEANLAADHNQLILACLKNKAPQYGLWPLFHEKPFAGLNGSGKHLNWSLKELTTGRSLLEPGDAPHENMVFLSFLCAFLKGVCDNSALLLATAASAGNDHRWGGHEAPPAVLSVCLGTTVDSILNQIVAYGKANPVSFETKLALGPSFLPEILNDNADRNRTSPLVFTGNKFEFRALGSSASVHYATAILNTLMCDGLRKLNTRLLQKSSQAPFLEKDLFAVLGEFIQETQHLRFEGNAYVPQWQTQAEERGLAVCAASSQAFEVFLDEQKTKVLQNCGVFSQNELASRFVLEMQKNIEQNCVECACAIDLAQSQILPACIEYSHTLLQHLHHSKSAGLPQGGITQFAQEFQDILSSMCTALNSLKLSFEKVKQAAHFASNALDARKDLVFVARQIHDTLKPQLHALRVAVDAAEARVPQKLWPILKYSTLLLDQK